MSRSAFVLSSALCGAALLAAQARAQYVGVGRGPSFMSWFVDGVYYQDVTPNLPDIYEPRKTIDVGTGSKVIIERDEITTNTGSAAEFAGLNPWAYMYFQNAPFPYPSGTSKFIANGIWGHRFLSKKGELLSDQWGPLESISTFSSDNYPLWFPLDALTDDSAIEVELLDGAGAPLYRFGAEFMFECLACQTTCSGKPEIGSVDYTIPVAMTEAQDYAAGQWVNLKFHQEDVAVAGAASVSLLAPGNNPSVIATYGSGDILQNVRVGDHYAVVQQLGGSGGTPLSLRITVSSDYLNPATTVLRTLEITNGEDSTGTDYIQLADTVSGKTSTSRFWKSSAGDWTMETGDGLRRETRMIVEAGGTRTVRTIIEERISTTPLAYATVSDRKLVYGNSSSGWRETATIVDPDGAALTTSTSYYGVGEDSSLDSSGSSEGVDRVKQVVHPTGAVEKHYYFKYPAPDFYDAAHVVKTPYAGVPDALETTTDTFTGVSSVTGMSLVATRITERVAGNVIGRIEMVREATAGGFLTETRTYSDATHYTTSYHFEDKHGGTVSISSDGTANVSSSSVDGASGMKTVTSAQGYVTGTLDPAGPDLILDSITEEVTDANAEMVYSNVYGFSGETQLLVSSVRASAHDGWGRATEFEHYFGSLETPSYTTEREYGCCGVARERDKFGIDTFFAYDALKRMTLTNSRGVTTEIVRQGLATSTHRYVQVLPPGGFTSSTGAASPANEISREVVDLAGDKVSSWARSPQDGSLVETTATVTYNPGGGIGKSVASVAPAVTDDGSEVAGQSIEFYLDGRMATQTGNLGLSYLFEYSANATGEVTEYSILDASAAKRETTFTQLDWAGLKTRLTFSSDQDGAGGNDFEEYFYNGKGQLEKIVDPDGAVQLVAYDEMGRRSATALDLNANGTIDYDADSVEATRFGYAQRADGTWVTRTSKLAWIGADANPTVLIHEDHSLDGFRRWTIDNPGIQTHEASTAITGISEGAWTELSVSEDGSTRTSIYSGGLLRTEVAEDGEGNNLYQMEFSYDSLNRNTVMEDSRSGISKSFYVSDVVDFVSRTEDATGRETFHTYDHRGRTKTINRPDTVDKDGTPVPNVLVMTHFIDGKLSSESGDGTYPRTYTYDYARRPETMTTQGTIPAVTRWLYDSSRGLLVGKRHNSPTPGSGTGVTYTHTPGGRVKTRMQSRTVGGNPLVTTYSYGTAANSSPVHLDQVSHSDGTPGVTSISRDRMGRPLQLTDGVAGTRTLSYAAHGPVAEESVGGSGILSGQKISTGYDSRLRPSSKTFALGSSTLNHLEFDYDTAGRFARVEDNLFQAEYRYHAGTGAIESVSYLSRATGARIFESVRKFDAANRIASITGYTEQGGLHLPVDHHAYSYNDANKVVTHANQKGELWSYGYKASGELATARKTAPGSTTPYLGKDYEYQYDGIGNRLLEKRGMSGGLSREFDYTPNALNQYDEVTHPDFLDVSGMSAASTVEVNGVAAQRQGDYFYKEVSEDNSSGPRWLDIDVEAGTATSGGSMLLPAASVDPGYDADGNLEADGQLVYEWDAENRLKSITRAAVSGIPYLRVEYDYDYQSRRIRTSKYSAPGTLAERTIFFYDGWKCVAELDAGGSLVKSYTWGLDVGGSSEDRTTGAVGGLLWGTDHGLAKSFIYFYDRTGNVTGLLDAATSVRVATYEYDGFGQLVACHGSYAKSNPFTYSTKHTDHATGLYYYGLRWYDPRCGRWLSRDPIEENGGPNTYAFLGNAAVNDIDVLGMVGAATVPTSDGRWVNCWTGQISGTPTQCNNQNKGGGASFNWTELMEEFLLDQMSVKFSYAGGITFPVGPAIFIDVGLQGEVRAYKCKTKEGAVRNQAEFTTTVTVWGGVGTGFALKKYPEPKGRDRNQPGPGGIKNKKLAGTPLPWRQQKETNKGWDGGTQHDSATDGNCECSDAGWGGGNIQLGIRAAGSALIAVEARAYLQWNFKEPFTPSNIEAKAEASFGVKLSVEARIGIEGKTQANWYVDLE